MKIDSSQPSSAPPEQPNGTGSTSPVLSDTPISISPSHTALSFETLKLGLILLSKKIEPMLGGTPFRLPFTVVNTIVEVANIFQLNTINAVLPNNPTQEEKEQIRQFSEFLVKELEMIDSLTKRSISPNEWQNTAASIFVVERSTAPGAAGLRQIVGSKRTPGLAIEVGHRRN
ncbi:hypothetical protein R3P38DRAFT_2807924 [Favolaschia claudopus]|uniref:Uncharacterized protein n=1 Tax=Favolaschia claudopus TaxID=2862362 RepID=A0AAV9ZI86_9AGAR